MQIAVKYLNKGDYYWSSGMFETSECLSAILGFAPEIYNTDKKAINAAQRDMDFIRVGIEEFKKCPDDSINYAIKK